MAGIVVALDGSPLAEKALPHARALLRADEELVLVRVVHVPTLSGDLAGELSLALWDESECYLAGLSARLAETGMSVRTRQAAGPVRDQLIQMLEEERPRLAVLASHGRSGFSRWLLGSVAEGVARAAPCPLWLVRVGSDEAEPAAPRFDRILVPLDGSEHSARALDLVDNLLEGRSAHLLLLAATDLSPLDLHDLAYRDALVQSLQDRLESLAVRARRPGLEIELRVTDAPAAQAILSEPADLIAMASHGRTGLSRWLLGSVAERVLRHSNCPVAMINPLHG